MFLNAWSLDYLRQNYLEKFWGGVEFSGVAEFPRMKISEFMKKEPRIL